MVVEVVMKFEFNLGVPSECINWLWDNVGEGNVIHSPIESNIRRKRLADDDWYYERVQYEIPSNDPKHDSGTKYVPTIFIEDEKKAMLFALRWA